MKQFIEKRGLQIVGVASTLIGLGFFIAAALNSNTSMSPHETENALGMVAVGVITFVGGAVIIQRTT